MNKNISFSDKLDNHLILYSYLCDQFGFNDSSLFIEYIKNNLEDYNSVLDILKDRTNKKIDNRKLDEYDENINRHFNQVKHGNIKKLQYYQYLSLMFTEIFLDNYFNDLSHNTNNLIESINNYVERHLSGSNKFTRKDLSKLAYWLATGSGKTLIMHINYKQFLYYNNKYENPLKIDNVILITPNEYMTDQHFGEFNKANINSVEFSANQNQSLLDPYEIKIFDINKLKINKKGNGEFTFSTDQFGSKNLLLVDEGHKGYKSDERTWIKIRDNLSKDGFCFEYSATFGQAINSDKELIGIYSKSIIFDYSYRYFYNDNYGKDFFILNLNKSNKVNDINEDTKHTILLGNLISFAEQAYIYDNQPDIVCNYKIENPLWMLLGSKVIANKNLKSDILDIINFFAWFVSTPKDIIMEKIGDLQNSKSGLYDDKQKDAFDNGNLFSYFKEKKLNSEEIYDIILNDVFGVTNELSGNLYLYDIVNSDGEIGVKFDENGNYIGLIDIGDKKGLMDLITEPYAASNIIKLKDSITSSPLFLSVNSCSSKIRILIGARKFIEGWNTYRISNITLLYLGKSEGSMIIQMFGRGVRLKGKNDSMKRELSPDARLKPLQILYIFGINADYLIQFKDVIGKEINLFYIKKDLPTDKSIYINNVKNLYVPTLNGDDEFYDKEFNKSSILTIKEYEDKVPLSLDLRSSISVIGTKEKDDEIFKSSDNNSIKSFYDYKSLIDFEYLYNKLLEFKFEHGFYNVALNKNYLSDLIDKLKFNIFLNENIQTENKEGIDELNNLVLNVVETYIEKLSNFKKNEFLKNKYEIKPLEEKYILDKYEVYIAQNKNYTDRNDVTYEEKSNITWNSLFDKFSKEIVKVRSDKSLYQPLVKVKDKDYIRIIPEGLNDYESKFVNNLTDYLNENTSDLSNYEFLLLRNGVKSKGIGFFNKSNWIYPDFILWVKNIQSKSIKVVFLDPHGIYKSYMKYSYKEDPKIMLFDFFNKYSNSFKNKLNGIDIKFDSYILSVTPYESIKDREEIANIKLEEGCFIKDYHIIFMSDNDNSNYIRVLLNELTK